MWMVKVSERMTKIFMNHDDYLNYLDYQENGLSLVSLEGRSAKFNDGARLTDVSFKDETPKRYVLHKDSKMFKDPKFTKKYLDLLREEGFLDVQE